MSPLECARVRVLSWKPSGGGQAAQDFEKDVRELVWAETEGLRDALQEIVAYEQMHRPCRCKPDGCGECSEDIAIYALRALRGVPPAEEKP